MVMEPSSTGPAVGAVEMSRAEFGIPTIERPDHNLGPVGIGYRLFTVGVDLLAPIAVYYALHAVGVGNVVALSVGAVPPGVGAAVKIVRERKIDQLAVIVLATLLASIGASFVTGSPRFLLAKDGWFMGIWGLWFLVTVRADRPAAFLFTRPLLEGRKAFTSESWDALWKRVPRFRRIWRVSSVMWGLGLLVDACVRVGMAYTLPVSLVPGLGGALYPATFVALQVITNVYYHWAGLWIILDAPWARSSRRLST